MARFLFGGSVADWTFGVADDVDGEDGLAQLSGGVEIAMWTSETGGSQLTDLLTLDLSPISVVVSSDGGDGRAVGQIPPVWGPDGVTEMWASASGGPRARLVASGIGALALAADAAASTAVSQLAQHIAERNPHITRMRDLGDVAPGTPAPLIGQVPVWNLTGWAWQTVEGVAGVTSVDGSTGAVDLTGTYLRRVLALTTGQLSSTLRSITYDHVPAVDAPDLDQVIQTHSTAGPLLTSWRNERGLWRAESRQGSLFDHLYVAVSRYDADDTHGWPYRVERRESNGTTRTHIGGIRWDARYATDLFDWVDITDVDPDETGDYAASTVVGPAALQVRRETTDICRLQGRITAAEITADAVLFALPAGYLPASSRLVLAPTDTGLIVPIELLVSGDAVVRGVTASSGPYEISVDDITFAVVEAPQDLGGWTVETVATATPSSTSPLTLTYAGVAGRLYIVIMSTNSAQTTAPGTVTDSGSNTWQLMDWAPQAGGTGRRIELWYVHAANPFASVSVPIPGSQTGYATLLEITGHDAGDPLDVGDADIRGSSTTPAALQITPSGTGRLVIAAVHANPNSTSGMTPDAGWLDLASNSAGHRIVYRTDAPASPTGVNWTFGTASGSGMVAAAINADGDGDES